MFYLFSISVMLRALCYCFCVTLSGMNKINLISNICLITLSSETQEVKRELAGLFSIACRY